MAIAGAVMPHQGRAPVDHCAASGEPACLPGSRRNRASPPPCLTDPDGGDKLDAVQLPSQEEWEIEAPDGQWYLVRTSGAGVQRFNLFNMLPNFVTELAWFLRRRTRWQVEVCQFDGFGVSHPPVLKERFDEVSDADRRAADLAASLREGRIGWDRWQRPVFDDGASG